MALDHNPGSRASLSAEEEDLLELIVYPTPVQLVGGEHDGAIVMPGFSLDALALQAATRIPTYGNDTMAHVPVAPTPTEDRQLLRTTGRTLAESYLAQPPLCAVHA